MPMGKYGLSEAQRELVSMGNALAIFSADFIGDVMTTSGYWALENPHRSFLWLLPAIVDVSKMPGVGFIHFSMKSFGTLDLKPTVLLSNALQLLGLKLTVPKYACPFLLRGQIFF